MGVLRETSNLLQCHPRIYGTGRGRGYSAVEKIGW